MNLFELFGKISIDTGNYQDEVQKAKKQSGDLKSAIQQAATSSDSLGKKIKDIANQYKKSTEEVKRLRIEYKTSAKETGSTSRETQELAEKLKQAENRAKTLKSQIAQLSDETKKAASGTKNFSEMLKSNLLSQIIIKGISTLASQIKDMAGSFITSAAEVKAETSAFSQTFGDFEKQAKEAIGRVADSSGILQTRITTLGSKIYAFARSSGGDAVQSMSLMEKALQAAADSAAYYDTSVEEAAETLQSFLKGNFANDAALGLSATEATRNAKAIELFGQKYQNLTEIQKQQTLLQMVMDSQKLSGAMGQAAREADGWENVQGNLNETFRQFQAKVGTPFLENLIPIIQQLTDELQNLISEIDWDEYADKVTNFINILKDGIKAIIDFCNGWDATNTIYKNSFHRTGKQIGKDFTDGITDGIKSGEAEILSAYQRAMEKLMKQTITFNHGGSANSGTGAGRRVKQDNSIKINMNSSGNDNYFSNAKKALERQIKYEKLELDEQLILWENFQNRLAKGGEEYLQIEDKIFDLKEAIWDKAYSDGKKQIDKQIKYQELGIEAQLNLWTDFRERYAEGSEEYLEIEDKIFDLQKAIREQNTENQNKILQEEQEAFRKAYQNNVKVLEKQIKYEELSLIDQISGWKRIQQQLIEDSEEYAEVSEKIFDLRYDAEKEYIEKIEKLQDEYTKTLKSRTEEIYNSYGLFDEAENYERIGGGALLRNLTNQVKNMDKYYTLLDKLKDRLNDSGVSDDIADKLTEEIRSQGIENMGQLSGLVNMGDGQLQKYINLYKQKQDIADNQAQKELLDFNNQTYQELQKSLDELKRLYEDEAPDIGEAFVDNLAKEIKDGKNTIAEAAKETAYAAVEAYKQAIREENVRKIDTVDFSSSALGRSTEGIVNSNILDKVSQSINLKVSFVLPDGRVIAEQYINDLIRVAETNGTPIANEIS